MKVNNVAPKFNYNSSVNQKNIPFEGYDARVLKAVVMTVNDEFNSFDIIKQMSEIGKKEGFKVYFANQTNKLYTNLDNIKQYFKLCVSGFSKWAQDMAVVTPNNKILCYGAFNDSMEFANRFSWLTKGNRLVSTKLIEGGNLFFVKNNGKNELFVGEKELLHNNIDYIKHHYGVDNVISIPQADFHLDMFIRPLNNKKVLVADDRLTIQEIKKAIQNLAKYKSTPSETAKFKNVQNGLKGLIKDFEKDAKNNKNPKADDIANVLKTNGYQPIFIPGRIYYTIPGNESDDLVHSLNYMNALVHEKTNGDLVFITNKSTFNHDYEIMPDISDKIEFDFEKMLIKYLKPYVKKENIYFVAGNKNKISSLLQNEGGGIHCLCNEIPVEISK